jgi:phosphoesterase RecJ-like protein
VLIYRLLAPLRLECTLPLAEGLYCSILSDTGSFRYQNTNSEALEIAAALLRTGVDPWRVASSLYETRPIGELQLLSKALQTLRLSADGRAAALMVDGQMLEETGCTTDQVDGFINFARGIEGTEVALLLRPIGRMVRVSMRSRGNVDVSTIAAEFGGGGHHNASGCRIQGEADQITEMLFAAVTKHCAG